MKRIFYLVLLSVSTLSVSAQYVSRSHFIHHAISNYLLPEEGRVLREIDPDSLEFCVILWNSSFGCSLLNGMHITPSTTVYGVVSSFLSIEYINNELRWVLSLSYDSLRAVLEVPLSNNGIMVRKRKCMINTEHPTFVIPSMHVKSVQPNATFIESDTLIDVPFYETYFSEPYVPIEDSIFIGVDVLEQGVYVSYLYIEGLYTDSADYAQSRTPLISDNRHISDTSIVPVSTAYIPGRYYPLVLPILTPNPDDSTQINPTPSDSTDTTLSAVFSAELLERYTRLLPTVAEAGGEVTVLSSFHLQAIEVYDATGRLVSKQAAQGLATTINTTSLPTGSYVVRIVTTAGATSKKLILR